ncbi:hypothetical protein ACMFMF_000410 [Clarireedia jacksonii]
MGQSWPSPESGMKTSERIADMAPHIISKIFMSFSVCWDVAEIGNLRYQHLNSSRHTLLRLCLPNLGLMEKDNLRAPPRYSVQGLASGYEAFICLVKFKIQYSSKSCVVSLPP